MAFPRAALSVGEDLVMLIGQIIEEESVDLIVVGRPVALSGRETASTVMADGVFAKLRESLHHASIIQWDERLTTREATRALHAAGHRSAEHRDRLDSASAVILLQHYLDFLRAP